jgi:hypothetical protein
VDLLFCTTTGDLYLVRSVCRWDGQSERAELVNSGSPLTNNCSSMALADANNDGVLDVFITGSGPNQVLKGGFDGDFTALSGGDTSGGTSASNLGMGPSAAVFVDLGESCSVLALVAVSFYLNSFY